MNLLEFKETLQNPMPPSDISEELLSLWFDGKGDWEKSHNIAQDINSSAGSLIHGYLHRKEGDISNAKYWYNRAGSSLPKQSLQEEWEALAEKFLS